MPREDPRVVSPLPERPTVSLPAACRIVGVSATTGYRLAKATGRLCDGVPVVRIGRQYRVPKAALAAVFGASEERANDARGRRQPAGRAGERTRP